MWSSVNEPSLTSRLYSLRLTKEWETLMQYDRVPGTFSLFVIASSSISNLRHSIAIPIAWWYFPSTMHLEGKGRKKAKHTELLHLKTLEAYILIQHSLYNCLQSRIHNYCFSAWFCWLRLNTCILVYTFSWGEEQTTKYVM